MFYSLFTTVSTFRNYALGNKKARGTQIWHSSAMSRGNKEKRMKMLK
jgi:hypothetical protein